MRESGFVFDKLLVVTDVGFIPTGPGPAASGSGQASLENQLPVAVAGSLYTGVSGSLTGFDGSGSFDPDADALTHSWSFGNGTALVTGENPSHVYASAGTYIASLTVNDGAVNSLPSACSRDGR